MSTPLLTLSSQESLSRKMSRLETSLHFVREEIDASGNVAGSTLVGLEHDAEKLADFCRFIRQQRQAGRANNE